MHIQAAVQHRLFGRDAGKLGKPVIELQIPLAEILFHIQILDLSGQLDLIVGRIEMRDRIDPTTMRADALPQFFDAVADR